MSNNKLDNKLNSRQHLVLINALKGMNQTDAYEAVYGPNPNSFAMASTLFRKPNFSLELERRQNHQLDVVQAQVLSKTEKRQLLADFARARLSDLLDDDGNIKFDRSKAKALKEYNSRSRLDQNGNPIITRSLKLIDPITAIMEDNKMDGSYAPTKHLVGKVQYNVVFKAFKEKSKGGEE